jgi:hypothetical protein
MWSPLLGYHEVTCAPLVASHNTFTAMHSEKGLSIADLVKLRDDRTNRTNPNPTSDTNPTPPIEKEEEEEEVEEGEEEEEEDIEVEDWVEEEEEAQEEVLEVKKDDEKNAKHEKLINEFYGFFAVKFGRAFVSDMKELSSHMPLTPKVVRSMMFNFGGKFGRGGGPNTIDRVPTLTGQIKEGKLEAEMVVKMASEGKLKEPKEMLHSQLASERHFTNSMCHEETRKVMYCGSWVSQDQLPSKE